MKMESRHKQALFSSSISIPASLQFSNTQNDYARYIFDTPRVLLLISAVLTLGFWEDDRYADPNSNPWIGQLEAERSRQWIGALTLPNVFLDSAFSERLIHVLLSCFVNVTYFSKTYTSWEHSMSWKYYHINHFFLTVKQLESSQVQNILPYPKNLLGFHRNKGGRQQW